ncbi:MAG: hypothetical protein ACYS6K_23375 [Planctomycetota bacterium]|jgi:hypothetical protein
MIRTFSISIVACWLICCPCLSGWTAELETTVKYVSAEFVFIDAGSIRGLEKGNYGKIILDDKTEITLEVVYVAGNSASAKVIEGDYTPRIGDKLYFTISDLLGEESLGTDESPTTTQPIDFLHKESQTENYKRENKATISGRFGIELYYQDDRELGSTDIMRPAVVIRSTIDNLFVNHLALSVNLRLRYIVRDTKDATDPETEWNNRIYEVALRYDNPASPLTYQAGRITSQNISGIGRFDGALMEYEFRDKLKLGVFGGSVANLNISKPQTDKTTAGIYSVYEKGNWQGHRVIGTLALVGRYDTGEIDREFIYEQIRYSWTRRLAFYQSSEVSINRDWREEAEGAILSLSNFLVNATYSPTNSISFDLGYDNRKLMHTLETKDTPDSLFDDALRQGFRAGINVRLPMRLRVWLRTGLRIRESEETETRTVFTGLSQRNILNTGITGSLLLNAFDSRYSTGTQFSIAASRYIFRVVYLEFKVGQSSYEFDNTQDTINYHWINLGASGFLTRHFYTSSYGEIYRGDSMNVNRIWLEIGYRL